MQSRAKQPFAKQRMLDLPYSLRASLSDAVFQRAVLRGLPELELPPGAGPRGPLGRREFLAMATAALASAHAAAAPGPLVFSPEDQPASDPTQSPQSSSAQTAQMPPDFWERPRELWLRRDGTKEEVRLVYWKDGALVAEGYWQACNLLRDRKANRMTTIDPTVLDVLRGIHGYYEAWRWKHPIVITSGYRTSATNGSTEGAAKNSMHLYGKAVDLYVPGIPADHIRRLGLYLQQGGVGYYPDNGFTHLDTGKIRAWRGKV